MRSYPLETRRDARPRVRVSASSSGRGVAPATRRLTVTKYHEDMSENVQNVNLKPSAELYRRNTSVG